MKHYIPLPNPIDDSALLFSHTNGDDMALQKLFERYRAKLFHFAWKLTKSSEATEEFVVDIFAKLSIGRPLAGHISCFDDFLQRVSYQKAIGFLRSVAGQSRSRETYVIRMSLDPRQRGDDISVGQKTRSIFRAAASSAAPKKKIILKLSQEYKTGDEAIAKALSLNLSVINKPADESRFPQLFRRFIDDTITSHEWEEFWTALSLVEADHAVLAFSDLWKNVGEEKLLPAYWDAMWQKSTFRSEAWQTRKTIHRLIKRLR